MKIAEVRAKSKEELTEMVASLKKEQMNLRFQRATGALENPQRFHEIRKTIARAKTVLKGGDAAPKATAAKEPAAKKAPARKTKAKKEEE